VPPVPASVDEKILKYFEIKRYNAVTDNHAEAIASIRVFIKNYYFDESIDDSFVMRFYYMRDCGYTHASRLFDLFLVELKHYANANACC
jgi:hypothetical protein